MSVQPAVDFKAMRDCLKQFDFHRLFVEELGWDRHSATLEIPIDGRTYSLSAVAHKRGMVAFLCNASDGGQIPGYAERRRIDRLVAKTHYEHLIIYTDADKTIQVWQWVKREPGKPAASREHIWHKSQSGEGLIQKLEHIAFTLNEEDAIEGVTEVAGRVRAGFDVERVTKRFYDRFKAEHDVLLRFIKGIPDDQMHRWYASVMLNRLMFIYFIQKKGFLDSDSGHLGTKLAASKREGKDGFYKGFLCPLFFEGFAVKEEERTAATNRLLGKVPYLNGGLFLRHQIEEQYGQIHIPDAAFDKIFDFFDGYQWHLDERPLRNDKEINPDVLGYIFEKYINQKQMGAYYTKEDITEYIAKNTIIPFLFGEAKKECPIAFAPGSFLWKLLREDPDRYIYEAVRRGVIDAQGKVVPLPAEIEAGIADIPKRGGWNRPADAAYALPTETWREHVARRQRGLEIRRKLREGEVHEINDLITLNLDIRQFAQDVITGSEGPELVRAFYEAIEKVTVLDPTCGSGAFLFAALNILQPLYEACLERMATFIEEAERGASAQRPQRFADFRKTLDRIKLHPNHDYFILKSIIVNNLYGVDIMEEAVEICKLRMFLKLVAQLQPTNRIEPLPDIDFNIRAGNTLVGYATRAAADHNLNFDNAIGRIAERAAVVDFLFQKFRRQQLADGPDVLNAESARQFKKEILTPLAQLRKDLDPLLAVTYGAANIERFDDWRHSHKPFHWFVEFFGIMKSGGFDVVIGNPPYLELRQIDYEPQGLRSLTCGAVHAMCIERSLQLLRRSGAISMIVPLSLVSTQRMIAMQTEIERDRSTWYGNFAWRPGKLFDAVNRALTIFVAASDRRPRTYATNYQKWNSDGRGDVIPCQRFIDVPRDRQLFWVPKLGDQIETALLKKVLAVRDHVADVTRVSAHRVFYRTTGGLYWKVFTDFAPCFRVNGRAGHSSRETNFTVSKGEFVHPLIAALSSDLFWWWYTITSNLRDLNPSDLFGFPLPKSAVSDPQLRRLGRTYLQDLASNSIMLAREQKQTGRTETQCFKIQRSKPVIEEIDRSLAKHYGFTDDETDFIINYDIKYRMGAEESTEAE